jgi:hypothetical protein
MASNVVYRNDKQRRSDKLSIRFGSLEASAQGTLAVAAIVLIVVMLVVFARHVL